MNRSFWENLASLCGVHVLNYVMPLMTLPLLARVLGPTCWGELAFAESYATYLSLFIEYGFGLSATRELAHFRDDPATRSRLLAGVLSAQVILTLCAIPATIALGWGVPHFAPYRPLLPLAFALGVFRAMNPFWYFQGIERIRTVALITAVTNIAGAAGILALVRSPADVSLALLLRMLAACTCFTVSLALAFRTARFRRPDLKLAIASLREGWSLFMLKGAVSFYTSANVLLLGIMAPPAAVAIYAGAEKIASAAAAAINPLMQAFYPRIAYLLHHDPKNASRTTQMSLLVTVSSGVLLGLTLFFGAPLLVRLLLGAHFAGTVPVLRVLSVLPPLIAASNVLGVQWMVPMHLDRYLNRIIISAGVVNIALALLLVPHFGQIGMASTVGISELLVTCSIIVLLTTRRLAPWRAQIPETKLVA